MMQRHRRRWWWMCLTMGCAPEGSSAWVQVTLADQQRLVGRVETDVLLLEGGLGPLRIPLADVGEIVPIEMATLGESGGHATIWLRNGSELVGRWDTPALSLSLDMGGETQVVALPVEQLARFQTPEGTQWLENTMRIRTIYGDDFLIDPARSRLTLSSTLGTFSPFLSECRSLRPLEAPTGPWQVELHTGTLLVGTITEPNLTLSLPLGPDQVTVPLSALVSIEQSTWQPPLPRAAEAPAAAANPSPSRAPATDEDWFSREPLEQLKR